MIQGKHIIEPTKIVNTETNTEYTFDISPDVNLDTVFDILPSNAIINKGRCGIGGTYLEVVIAKRNSIIIVPTNAIIDNKCFDTNHNLKDGYYVVRGKKEDFKFEELKEFMLDTSKFKKIFCTPESLRKIVQCEFPLNQLYKEWFILFDEAHTTITDDYRKNMLDAFSFFFKFENKAMISATPYEFSNPQLQSFDRYTLNFTSTLGTIEVFSTANVNAKLHQLLKDPNQFPHRVHIFLNSVNGIAACIKMAELKDCSIFCKDDKDNMKKLDELKVYFKAKPLESTFSKFNFYTTKYFEGWDLNDENATLIVVSDINNMTLRNGVSNKCVQAIGRNREKSNRLIHLTNDWNKDQFELFESIVESTFKTASSTINSYIHHLDECKIKACNIDKDILESPIKYGDRAKNSDEVILNYFKVDRIINRQYCEQEYNHVNFIKQAWEQSHYKVVISKHHVLDIPEIIKRMKTSHKTKIIAQYLEDLKNSEVSADDYRLNLAKLKVDFEDIIEYYNELGFNTMESCDFDKIKLRKAYRKSKNIKGMKLVADDYFLKYGHKEVLTKKVSTYLQGRYAVHSILIEGGAPAIPKRAAAKHLCGLFTKVTRTKNKGKQHVWRIDEK